MKKIAKISLVAAIAVAGFTTANAQPLEEAIKNVDVTGSVVYRYNDYKNDASNNGVDETTNKTSQTNNYKVALGLASKVNEDVKFNSRFVIGAPSNTGTGDAGFATLNSSENADQNVGTELTNAFFSYTGVKNTTVNVGKQGLTTPWTVAIDSDGNEQTGTGILALSTVGPVTLAGAYFNQTNIGKSGGVLNDTALNTFQDNDGDGIYTAGVDDITGTTADAKYGRLDVATVGAIVAAGPVTLDAWYLDMQELFDSYTLGAKSTPEFAGIKFALEARHTALDLDNNSDDNSLTKFVVSGDAGLIDAKLAYAFTNDEGGLVSVDSLDSATNLLGWTLSANNKLNADYVQAVIGVDILSNLNLSANYNNLQYINENEDDMTEEELYAQLVYKMSKNLSTYVRYGTYTKDNDTTNTDVNDDTRGRLQVEYTF